MTDQPPDPGTDVQESRTPSGSTTTEAASAPVHEPAAPGGTSSESGDSTSDGGDDGGGKEKASAAAEFDREHDPADHDVAAGEELRQRGDWTADEAGGPQVWDAEGNLVEGTSPAEPTTPRDQHDGGDAAEGALAADRRTSSLDEVRDGGYSVGSAAVIHDGAVPLGHPVKAWESSKTFATPDHPGYSDSEPELWFTDAGAAQRAGFRPAG